MFSKYCICVYLYIHNKIYAVHTHILCKENASLAHFGTEQHGWAGLAGRPAENQRKPVQISMIIQTGL